MKGNVRVYPTKAHAKVSFLSKKPISAVQTLRDEFGILFYENGSNRGEIKLLMLDRNLEEGISVCHGLQYWKWNLTEALMDLDDWEIKDFVVLLQKYKGGRVSTLW